MLSRAWKTSSVVPIPKTDNNSDAKNYRPISLLSVTSKSLEAHPWQNFDGFATLSENQWRFCSGKSTTNSYRHFWQLQITSWRWSLVEKQVLNSAPQSFDWKTAGRWPGLQWITDYLTNCMQYVVVNGISSKPPPMSFPLCPRGLSLGPFFSSFTSMELLSYCYHLRANWLCTLMIFCCTGLLGNQLTINFCSRMCTWNDI